MELASVKISHGHYSGSPRPLHCFLDTYNYGQGAQMILNTNAASTGSCSTTYKCICKAQTS
jgi:hypothetical protein